MSLLDDVSIVVTPNGYKAGELYAVVPEPSEGSEEVTDGNFPSPNTSWSLSGWEILGNLAKNSVDGAGNNLYQGSVTSVNQLFKVVITATITAGSVKVMLGGGTGGYNEIGEATSTGTFTYYGTSFGTDNRILLQTGTGSVIGSVQLSNISVKEYTSADMDVTRATAATRVDENGLVNYAEVLGGDLVNTIENLSNPFPTFTDNGGGSYTMATTTTAYSGFEQPASDVFAVQVGEIYKLTFDFVLNSGALDLELFIGSASVGSSYGNKHTCQVGSNTALITIFTSNSSARLVSQINQPANMTISNIVLKKVDRDNVPRIDYTGGGCPHILAEPQRTNLFPYSEDFSQWVNISSTDTPNYSTAPDGTNTATRLLTSSQDSSYLYVSSLTISDATPYTLSIYVKSNGNGLDDFRLYTTTGGTSANLTATTEWQRFDCNLTSTTTSTNIGIRGVGGQDTDVLVWGAQVEEGSYATSYIPNFGTSAGVTRNQDIFTRGGIGSLINSEEGVLFVEMAALANDLTYRTISLNNGTNDECVRIRFKNSSNSVNGLIRNGGSARANISHQVSDIKQFHKLAFKYKSGDSQLWVDGVKVGTSTDTFALSTQTQLNFNQGTSSDIFFGKVRQLQVYNTVLTDEQLLQLTGTSGTDFYESYAEMASALTYTIQ